MKLVQNLPEIFEEFGEKKREAFLEIKEYKDKGIPVIGMYCAYFPTELAMAAGAIPVGLCSFSNETITAAERDLPKSMCPLVKSRDRKSTRLNSSHPSSSRMPSSA